MKRKFGNIYIKEAGQNFKLTKANHLPHRNASPSWVVGKMEILFTTSLPLTLKYNPIADGRFSDLLFVFYLWESFFYSLDFLRQEMSAS